MVAAVLGSLARRGFEMGAAHMQKDPKETYQLPTWGAILLGSTVIFFVVVSSMVEYTFGRLIPTLLMVESPEAIVFEPLTTEDPDAPINKNPTDPELLLVEQKPITSSFRKTIKHLHAKGGFRARFRGISIFVVNVILVQWIAGVLNIFLPFLLGPIIATVLLAQVSLAWTHIVISDPNPKRWYRRIPSMKTWRKVAGPTAVYAVAEQFAVVLPAYLATKTGFLGRPEDLNTSGDAGKLFAKGFSVLLVTLCLVLFVIIPAKVTLVRVQASLLPDEVESIVPFDRSFGGKVIPAIVGGSGVIGMLDAWKTFDFNARVRLVKAYAKVFLMQTALSILFFVTIIAQIALIVGKDYKKLFPGDAKDGDEVVFN
ncbi:hypothetical protein D0Z07_4422 [Hyphodiscus hymeniophilus]|uniref:Uncharacterized protein n=1 Tax=Hyphodiscus hymeniophilus TaxID=353542 RepID=A0A9P6VKQ9_9HELO|nr:hypothetical protein D0Z07_4422 [Hyphodiscus hymeniophilus]